MQQRIINFPNKSFKIKKMEQKEHCNTNTVRAERPHGRFVCDNFVSLPVIK